MSAMMVRGHVIETINLTPMKGMLEQLCRAGGIPRNSHIPGRDRPDSPLLLCFRV